MSWLGGQLSSFTEKLTDLTKEILIDETDNIDTLNPSNGLSYKELLEKCKEKDERINNLISEKEDLEKSIEELDKQHQEAIEAVLLQKNQVFAENGDLKEKLAAEKCKQLEIKTDFHSSYGSSDVSTSLNQCENHSSELLSEDISLISILQSVSDCSEDEKFKKQIHWLEKQKNFILADDTSSNNSVYKIDNYINFLEALHSQSLYSVVDEICTIFNSLAYENSSLKEKLISNADNYLKTKDNTICSCKANLKFIPSQEESDTQTNTSDFQTISCAVTTQTVPYEEHNSSQKEINKPYEVNNSHSQTYQETSSITVQTDCDIFKTLNGEISNAKNTIEELKQGYSVQEEKNSLALNALNQELESSSSIISNQQVKIDSLENEIKSLNQELESSSLIITNQQVKIDSLENEIKSLTVTINDLKKTSTVDKENMFIRRDSAEQLVLNFEGAQKPVITEAEMTVLQSRLKTSELEKGRLLCVLNEKTQECSSLKAEVHKLTSIVASEKQALSKLQQDICNLKQTNGEKSDPELTKEAIKKLSTIIKDKDLEIESLTQKNSTLTTLIQNDTPVPEQMQSLMDEKVSLSKQLNKFKAERDKIMLSYNARDKEYRECASEVKQLTSLLAEQKEKLDSLEQSHSSLAQQYEEKQKSLINAQNDTVRLKQRVSELEQELLDVKAKHLDLYNKVYTDSVIQITKEELHDKDSKIEKITCSNVEKDHLIQEKDCMIHDLSQRVKTLKLEAEQEVLTNKDLHDKISNLTIKLKEENSSLEQIQKEKGLLEKRLLDRSSELELLKDLNERLSMTVKEKEFAVQTMTEKISSLSQYISSDSSSGSADVNQILADSETIFSEAQKFRHERDETLLALNQSKQENQSLRNEIQRMKSNEVHLENQLSRLREHLLEIEDNYTSEALKYEEREKSLKDDLFEVKRRADINSTAIVDTNQRASIQIASLQEQLSIVANQRDEALSQISSLEDKVLQHSTAVNKLQLVLEQMQKGNERKIKEVDNKWQSLFEKQKEANQQLEKQLEIKQMQVEESSKALEAASRLSEQLDAKEEIIVNLKNELYKTENQVKSTALEISSIRTNTEGKVDRLVMKSLVLGYFSTPPGQKSEVVRLLARVLDFNQEEMEKAGIVVGKHPRRQESRGLFSSIFNRLPSLSSAENNLQQPEKSFTTLFVQFLESESQPIVPMPFPAEKMAEELKSKTQSKKKPESLMSSSRPSPLLLDIDSAFPTFTPLASVEYSMSPAPAILKEVLE